MYTTFFAKGEEIQRKTWGLILADVRAPLKGTANPHVSRYQHLDLDSELTWVGPSCQGKPSSSTLHIAVQLERAEPDLKTAERLQIQQHEA